MSSIKHHLVPALALLATLWVCGWFVTHGTGRLFEEEPPLGRFYDAQGDSLLQGRFDVPCQAIEHEAIIVNDKCYGYFGVTPALIRIPLNWMAPELKYRWARLSMLAASALALFFGYLFALEAHRLFCRNLTINRHKKLLFALWLLVLGLGTTNIFLLSRAVIYHEAIIWSNALALASLYFALRYTTKQSLKYIVLACAFCFFSIHARPVAALGALIACVCAVFLPALRRLKAQRAAFVSGHFAGKLRSTFQEFIEQLRGPVLPFVMLLFPFIILSYLLVAYAKFGSFDPAPMKYHVELRDDVERLNRTGGKMLHWSNIRFNASQYFGLHGAGRQSIKTAMARFPEARIDWLEPVFSIPVGMPSLLFLSIVGTAACVTRGSSAMAFRLLLIGSFLGASLLMFFAAISYRYVHDFFPCLVIGSILGLNWIIERQGVVKKVFLTFFVVTAIFSIFLNTTSALIYQTTKTNVGDASEELKQPAARLKGFVEMLRF